MATFPELLNGYMARTGIGDTELSRRIGVSRLTLVRWKEGVTSRPRHRDDVLRCAEELRLTPEERNEFLASAGFAPEEASPTPPTVFAVFAVLRAGTTLGRIIRTVNRTYNRIHNRIHNRT